MTKSTKTSIQIRELEQSELTSVVGGTNRETVASTYSFTTYSRERSIDEIRYDMTPDQRLRRTKPIIKS